MNYIINNELQVIEIGREMDRRKENIGRAEGDRRKTEAAKREFEAAKDGFQWSLVVLVITIAVVLTNIGQ
jgi:hypothetical protein